MGTGPTVLKSGDGEKQLIIDTKNDRFGFGTEPNVLMDMKTNGPAVQRLQSENNNAALYLDGATGGSIQFYKNNSFRSMIAFNPSNNSLIIRRSQFLIRFL